MPADAAPDRRIELKGDVPGLVPFFFSDDGKYLAATNGQQSLRVWNVEAGRIVASIGGLIRDAVFAAGGRVLVVQRSSDVKPLCPCQLTSPMPNILNSPFKALSPGALLTIAIIDRLITACVMSAFAGVFQRGCHLASHAKTE